MIDFALGRFSHPLALMGFESLSTVGTWEEFANCSEAASVDVGAGRIKEGSIEFD